MNLPSAPELVLGLRSAYFSHSLSIYETRYCSKSFVGGKVSVLVLLLLILQLFDRYQRKKKKTDYDPHL